MDYATGTLANLTTVLNGAIAELSAPVTSATGTLASATSQLNALLEWRGMVVSNAIGTLESAVKKYNTFVDVHTGKTQTAFRRIKWAAPPAGDADNQVTIVLGDGRTFTATKIQIAALDTRAKACAALEAVLTSVPDIFLHLNRNGRWAIATGQPPEIWPEDNPRVRP